MADLTARDAVLIKYLNEAYGKEKQLETVLQAQIGRTENMTIKKRLREHLKETKAHGRSVASRIKALGGKADTGAVVRSRRSPTRRQPPPRARCRCCAAAASPTTSRAT